VSTLDARVREGFIASGVPDVLVDEILVAFRQSKRRFYKNDLRPSEIEGGRFSEGVFRILQWASTGDYSPLSKPLPPVDKMLKILENADVPDSVRLHIPRTLRLIYDIRSKRDAAHLGDDIDPNEQDATLVVRNMEWVLGELVRLFHDVPPEEAHAIIENLVSKEIPLVQVFDGCPRVLRQLKASDHVLVLLYWRGAEGASFRELECWVRSPMRKNLKRTLSNLNNDNLVHHEANRYYVTRLGEHRVEQNVVLEVQ
jgi:hypothetical protein